MWIHLDRDHLLNVRFVFGVLSDLAAQLVGAPAVHAPRFAALARLDCAQALEEQEAPRIPGAHGGNLASDLVGGIFVEPINMPPQLLVAVLALDRLARLPLLFRNAFEMTVAMSVQTVIGHKHRLDDRVMLPDRN